MQRAAASIPIRGWCAPQYERVRQAFVANFCERPPEEAETGAAVSIWVKGELVVDLAGGYRDQRPLAVRDADANGDVDVDVAAAEAAAAAAASVERPEWKQDTLVNAFSVGKGLTALVVAQLYEDGALHDSMPLTELWPEYGADHPAARKTTVLHVLSHQAGQVAIRRRLTNDDMYNQDTMAAALAANEPWWEPGTAHGYHTNTFSPLVKEIVRRATGGRDTVGSLLRRRVAQPLGVADEVMLGLPEKFDPQVAEFSWPMEAPQEMPSGLGVDEQMQWLNYFNPPGFSGAGLVNTRRWRAAEFPSTNLHASARGVARIYAALAEGGMLEGTRIIGEEALRRAGEPVVHGPDRLLGRVTSFARGFQRSIPERRLGLSDSGFGHFGLGGSLGFCDPENRVGFGYVMNRMGTGWQSPRNKSLVDALYACLQ